MTNLTRCGALALCLATCACAQMPRAWERGHLASPEMAWDPDVLLAEHRDHMFVSKEAAAGGAGIGGGGCGCN